MLHLGRGVWVSLKNNHPIHKDIIFNCPIHYKQVCWKQQLYINQDVVLFVRLNSKERIPNVIFHYRHFELKIVRHKKRTWAIIVLASFILDLPLRLSVKRVVGISLMTNPFRCNLLRISTWHINPFSEKIGLLLIFNCCKTETR